MPYSQHQVSRVVRILFPIVMTIIVSLIASKASPLIATLMFGNLLRESLVVERLSNAAQYELANLTTIFLGLVIGGTMEAGSFFNFKTGLILLMGLFAFGLDTAGGLLFGKLMYILSGKKFNPLIGGSWNQRFPHVSADCPKKSLLKAILKISS